MLKQTTLFVLALVSSAHFAISQQLVEKYIVLEHYKGTWCGICPEGQWLMDDVLAKSHRFLEVSVQLNDPMETPGGDKLAQTYTSGIPSMMVDRKLFNGAGTVILNRFDLDTFATEQLSVSPKVAINGNSTYNVQASQLTVEMDVLFLEDMQGDLRMNVFVLEDKITGYPQANGDDNIPGSPYFGLGDPIVNFEHNNVLRRAIGDTWGEPNIIADSAKAGEVYRHTFTTNIPSGWDTANLELILLMQEYDISKNEREIHNALPLGLNDQFDQFDDQDTTGSNGGNGNNNPTSIQKHNTSGLSVGFYGKTAWVDQQQDQKFHTAKFYTISGALIKVARLNGQRTVFSLADQQAGIYLMELSNQKTGHRSVHKVVLHE